MNLMLFNLLGNRRWYFRIYLFLIVYSIFYKYIAICNLGVLYAYLIMFDYLNSYQQCLTMTCKSALKDHNGNMRDHSFFFVSSLVFIGKPYNFTMEN